MTISKSEEKTSPTITIALAGNPNAGKTTLFNAITGAHQHVGNYPGVTVEKKEGKCKFEGTELNIVDLPGTYSLTAYSIEELVARNYIINDRPDVVLDVVDASNLERNLYLATQLIEIGTPLVLVLNMIDVASCRGCNINKELLSSLLDIPVVTAVASKGEGTQEVLRVALGQVKNKKKPGDRIIKYDKEIEIEIDKISSILINYDIFDEKYSTRWVAIKLLENDSEIIKQIKEKNENSGELLKAAEKARNYLENFFGEEVEFVISDRRYGFVNGACKEAVRYTQEDKITASDKIDLILTNRILGIPIFVFFMWLVFHLTFTIGSYPMAWIESVISLVSNGISSLLNDGIVKSIIIEGIIGGVGSVLVFLPNILLLFLAIAFLEDTGYMARVAFIMDKLMHLIGLHGRAFIPMLIGCGCSVPAIMATRTLDNEKNRLTTIMIIPFMSCSAKLPVYTLLIAAFFSPDIAGTVLFSVYIIGVIIAIIAARIFNKYLLPGESSFFIMELPPYRVPTLKSILLHMWERTWLYLQKAGTVILGFSVLIWILTNFPQDAKIMGRYKEKIKMAGESFKVRMEPLMKELNISPDKPEDNPEFMLCIEDIIHIEESKVRDIEKEYRFELLKKENPQLYELCREYIKTEDYIKEKEVEMQNEKMKYSFAGRTGKFIEPAIKPLGFDWKIGISLLTGFAAKEVVVSSLGTIYSVEDGESGSVALRKALREDKNFTPLVAYALMIFILLYVPCIGAVSVVFRETNIYWTLFLIIYTTSAAWILSFIIYQGGRLSGF